MADNMRGLLKALMADQEDFSSSYEEGRELLRKVCVKLGEKYKMSIMAMCTRDDQNHHAMSLINMSPVALAKFMATHLKADESQISKAAMRLIPDAIWKKAMRKRYRGFDKILWAFIGGAGVVLIYNIMIGIRHMAGGM